MNIELFHLLRPYWLLALIPFLAAVILLARRHNWQSGWRNVVAPELLPLLLQSHQPVRRIWPFLIISLAGVLSIIALAGPTWERIPQPVFRSDDALIIALDLSRSMDAQDVKPSRLQRARYKIADILKSRTEGQAALIVYAADAFTVTPLTDDDDTIISQLPALTTGLVPAQGSRVDRALELASRLLRQASQPEGRILLITDEIEAERGMEAADQLAATGYRLYILGMGTADGAPIPTTRGSLKDRQGNIVVARLNADNLQRIALAGNGRYVTVTSNDSDIRQLNLDKYSPADNEFEKDDDRASDIWKEMGPWLLLPVLPLAALAFRRGILVLAVVLLLPIAPRADALELMDLWHNLWQTPDQQAQELFDNGEAAAAANRFEQPLWKGSAHYSAGNYQKALESFQSVGGAEARYNEGNALVRLGQYEDAINAYEQAIRQSPDHADAIHNKTLAVKLLERQEQQPPPMQQQQGDQQSSENSQQAQGSTGEQEDASDQSESTAARQADDESERSAEEAASEDQLSEQQASMPDAQSEQSGQEDADAEDASAESLAKSREQELAREQWLKRISDNDPAGLLKRKFQHQYRQRARTDKGGKNW